jgi:hypothetical protein
VTFLCLVAPALALALLAAHFLRASNGFAIALCVVMIGLLFVRRRWAARTIQAALVLGAIEWLRLAATLVAARQAMGEPFQRLAFILGGVAAFTALCALVFQTKGLRAWFRFDSGVTAASRAGDESP